MDRLDYYFRQKVTEAELDLGFANSETADWNFVVDADLVGIHFGLSCGEQGSPNMTVLVTAGAAYDSTGRRIRVPSNQSVNCAADYNSVSTVVASVGNERWVSIFAGFTRNLTDPRTDGNGLTVYFSRAETFETRVVAGVEAPVGTSSRPSLDSSRVLIADVLLAYGTTAVHNADINTERRQDIFSVSSSPVVVVAGRVKAAVTSIVAQLASHINSTSAHAASAITYAGGATWADGETNGATDVESQLDKVIDDLAGGTGTSKLGSGGSGGSWFLTVAPGTLYDQLVAIVQYVDAGPLGTSCSTLTTTSVLSSERQVYCDTTGGAFTVTLPTPAPGRCIHIKDSKGNFGTNAVTLVPSSGAIKIEGLAANRDLAADWGSYRVHSDGTDWYID